MHRGYSVPGVVTGKPHRDRRLGRSCRCHRVRAPSTCIAEAGRARSACRWRASGSRSRASATSVKPPPDSSHEAGARIVAITDVRGGVFDEDGLDVPYLRRHLSRARRPSPGAPGTRADHQRRAVRARCRHPRPGRDGRADHRGERRRRSERRILAEAANGPVTPEADPILARERRRRSCRTSCATPAASSSATSSGRRTGRRSHGRSTRSTSACVVRSWPPPMRFGPERRPTASIRASQPT